MAAPSTARVHKFRARQDSGRMVLSIEVDEAALIEALRDAGLLRATEVDSRDAITRATTRVLEVFYGERTR